MSQRGIIRLVLVGLLVLTAGCSGVSDEGTTTTLAETQTTPLPDDSPTTAQQGETAPTTTRTQTDTDSGLPPLASRDWTTDGRLNASTLFLRHVEALRAASGYQIQSNFTYTLENGSQSVSTFRTLVDTDRAVLKVRRDDLLDRDQSIFNRRYVNENSVVIVREFENGTVLRRSSSSPSEPLNQTVRRVPVEDTGFAFGFDMNWTTDGRTVLDGEPVYRYRAGEFVGSSPFRDQATLSSATMLVDRDGRIRRITIEAQGEFSFTNIDRRLPATFSFEVTLSELNTTTVETPLWADTGN